MGEISAKSFSGDKEEGLKVLIVEDDEASEFFLELSLENISAEIIKVSSGSEAVETCRANPDIDLVLMDIKIPVFNGYEATRQIREFNPNIIIIAQTAYGLKGDREKALRAGCNDYIAKPMGRNLLIEVIERYFQKISK